MPLVNSLSLLNEILGDVQDHAFRSTTAVAQYSATVTGYGEAHKKFWAGEEYGGIGSDTDPYAYANSSSQNERSYQYLQVYLPNLERNGGTWDPNQAIGTGLIHVGATVGETRDTPNGGTSTTFYNPDGTTTTRYRGPAR